MPSNPNDLMTRASIRAIPESARDDDRSVEFVLSTEQPVVMRTWEHGDINETLIASGVQIPDNRQVPLLDTHNRYSVEDVLGSVREIRVEGKQVVGRAFFAKSQRAFDSFVKVRDGHVTDISVGYRNEDATLIPEGQRATVAGREFEGPALVVTRWSLKEASLAPIGADSQAKARAEDQPATPAARAVEQIQQEATPMPNETPIQSPPVPPVIDERQLKDAVAKAQSEAKARTMEIVEACRLANSPDAEKFLAGDLTPDQVRKELLAQMSQKLTPIKVESRVEMGQTARDKFRAAAADALAARAIGRRPDQKPVDGADQLSRMGMFGVAQMCLRQGGINPDTMGREEVLQSALGRRSSSSVPSLNTGDFIYILADVAHKSMMLGWTYAQTTYQFWCRIGDLMDFKATRRVSLSDAPNLLETPEGGEVQQGVMTNTGESITLVTYARKLCLTRQALINDDLGAFNTIFRAFGARAANLVNALPYAVLEANAALADTGTLFNTDAVTVAGGHCNNDTAAAISSTTLAAGIAKMFAQAAPQGCKLNLMPKFLLTGAAYMTQAQISCGSLALSDATYNSGVLNPFNVLTPIADANVPGNDWFLIADPSVADTVEVAFLDGKRTPTITQEETSPILGMDFTAYIDATAKALDFRGLYKNG